MIRAALLAIALLAAPLGAQTAEPAAVSAPYRLGSSDVVEIVVANFPELTTRTRIDTDNSVTLPLIGKVTIGGMAAGAAAREIEARYQAGGFVNAPNVRVEIMEFQSRKASVLGQVTRQGMIALDRPYTVAELLAQSGGLGGEAGDSATLVRQLPNGETLRVPIDLALLERGAGAAALPVQPGDVIMVPRAATISVVGAVNKAGVYRLTPGMTVQQALAMAGDIARIGTRNRLKIRRPAESGGASTIIKAGLDDVLKPGDVIVVRERIF